MAPRRYSAGIVRADISLVVGNDRKVVTTGYREFVEDVAHVSFQRLDGYPKPGCGLAVGISAGYEIDDFTFSGRQSGNRGPNADPLVNVQQMPGDIGGDGTETCICLNNEVR